MKTVNKIAWTMIAALTVFLVSHWVTERCLADQIDVTQTNAVYIHDFTPPVVYECSIHGVLDRNAKTGTTMEYTLNGKEIGVWCFECMADFLNKNLPPVRIVDPNQTE